MKNKNPILEVEKNPQSSTEERPLKIPEGDNEKPKIIKRYPLDKEVPVTIEYHFKERWKTEEFKIPKKYKKEYDLLKEVFPKLDLSKRYNNIHSNPLPSSFYRILQLKINEIAIGNPEKLYRCMYCGEDFSMVMRCEEGRFCSWSCYELWEKQEKAMEVDIIKDRYSEGEFRNKK